MSAAAKEAEVTAIAFALADTQLLACPDCHGEDDGLCETCDGSGCVPTLDAIMEAADQIHRHLVRAGLLLGADQRQVVHDEGRVAASEAITAHANRYCPGTSLGDTRATLRRHLGIAARVALPTMTGEQARKEILEALEAGRFSCCTPPETGPEPDHA